MHRIVTVDNSILETAHYASTVTQSPQGRMRHFAIALAAGAICTLARDAKAQQSFGWTISASSTDPFLNTGAATRGVAERFLWFNCGSPEGISSAEFDLQEDGIRVLAFTPMSGHLNAGGARNLLLAVGGCPTGPVVVGRIVTLDREGSLGLKASENGIQGAVDCQSEPTLWGVNWVGYSNSGVAPPGEGDPSICGAVDSVRGRSFGLVKGLYR